MTARPDSLGWEDAASPDRMPALAARFKADRDCLSRLYQAPYSASRRERMRRFLASWHQTLEKIPFDTLTRSDQADWLLLRSLLAADTRTLECEEQSLSKAASLLPFADSLVRLEEQRLAMEDVDPASAAETLDQAAAQIQELCAGLKGSVQAGSAEARGEAARILAGLRPMLASWFAFYHGYDPLFTWWVENPCLALEKRLADYAAFLRETVTGAGPDAILGSPIGREALLEALSSAQIAHTPEELIAAGRAEMNWCRRELRRAAAELGHGDDWRAALEQVKRGHVAPGRQPALVRDLAREAIAYIEAEGLISVPPLAAECWRMEMMSPERQKINPFFLGGESIVISFPTQEMDQAQKRMSLRGNNRAFGRATVQHELIPGHRLQAFYQERWRPYRRLFYTPFWTEGWTLHWEMLLWERGFARTPEERMGMLFWRQHRGARVLFSLAYHLGQMTSEECVEMLVNEVGHERANALAEVRRSFEGGYDPLYQAAYLIGGLQMHALYQEFVGEGHWSACDFHEAVLRENCMPIAMLRALLTGDVLARDFQPEWRFLKPAK
jgi:uncharacterized protein (DUF885 family)